MLTGPKPLFYPRLSTIYRDLGAILLSRLRDLGVVRPPRRTCLRVHFRRGSEPAWRARIIPKYGTVVGDCAYIEPEGAVVVS